MTDSVDLLFRPFSAGNLELDNRLVMAPMTRSLSPGGIPNDDVAAYYRRRAEGGTGLLITEGTTVDHDVASMDPDNIPLFHGTEALAGWKNVVNEVHAAGGKIMPQLWHVGMARNPSKTPNPEAASAGPSGLVLPGKKVAEPMSEAEVEYVINAFADAAESAKAIGFDGVEIHGAHGYLIDQFFWSGTNVRDDAWAGNIEERARFGVEIVKAIRHRVGADFPVVLRFSQWKQQDYDAKLANTPEELERFLKPLDDAGVDVFHCSTRRFWLPEFEGSDLNLAGWTKKLLGKPTITVGSVGLDQDFMGAFAGQSADHASLDNLLERLANDEFDLVGLGRVLLSDSEWPNKVRNGQIDQLIPFTKAALAKLA